MVSRIQRHSSRGSNGKKNEGRDRFSRRGACKGVTVRKKINIPARILLAVIFAVMGNSCAQNQPVLSNGTPPEQQLPAGTAPKYDIHWNTADGKTVQYLLTSEGETTNPSTGEQSPPEKEELEISLNWDKGKGTLTYQKCINSSSGIEIQDEWTLPAKEAIAQLKVKYGKEKD